MSLIDEYKEKNTKTNVEYNNMLTLAIQVSGLEDNKYIIGKRLDNQEDVKVYLRDLKKELKNSKYKRPSVQDLFKKTKNGILKFEHCYLDENGAYSSKWGKVLSDDENKTQVAIVKSSVYYGKIPNSENEFVQVSVVYQSHKKIVKDIHEFKNIMIRFLQPKTPGSKNFSFIKINDGEQTEVLRAYGKSQKNNDNINVNLTGEESFEEFTKTDSYKMVEELIKSESITIEIIPARIIYPGSNYKEKLLEQSFLRETLSTVFKSNIDDANKPQGLGYKNCILTLRSHDDGTPYIIDIAPIGNDDPVLPNYL